jgi:hypothetical protein
MATQPAAARRVSAPRAAEPDPVAWRAYHIFYHADRDRLLDGLVRPLVAALLAEGEIRAFYFIRYNLGGPHVRLRVKPVRGRAARVDDRVRAAAADFFARSPSGQSVAGEAILRQNRGIVATDPNAGGAADALFPDNSVVELPAFFEVERYGGPALLRHSLEYFEASSVEALGFVAGREGRSAGQRLSAAGRLCVRQAWAFARDGAEFAELLGYASRLFPGELMARFAERGDEAFGRQPGAYVGLVRDELESLAPGAPGLAGAALRLAWRTRHSDAGTRWVIAASQLHMTANRLGLLNPEELYLGQILARASLDLAAADPALWHGAWRGSGRRGGPGSARRPMRAAAVPDPAP